MIDHLLKFITAIVLCFPVAASCFEHWHVSTEKDLKSISIVNRKATAQVLWISGPIKQLSSDPEQKSEQSYTLPAFGKLEIPLLDFQGWPWVHLKTENDNSFLVTTRTRFDQEVLINPGSSNRWSARARPETELLLMNLAPFAQKIKVSDLNQNPQHQFFVEIEAFGKTRQQLPSWSSGKTLLIEGEARIQGFMLSKTTSQSFQISRKPSSLSANPQKVYFRMADNTDSQSYIVGLTDEKMITQAKDQLRQPPGQSGPWLPRILVAEIEYGSGQENRDFSKPGAPVWSWHVSKAYSFAHLAHQDCDGSAEMIEELLQVWRQGSRTICFWNYKVLEQVPIEKINGASAPILERSLKRLVPASLRP